MCVFKEMPVGPRRRRSSRSIRVELQQELAYRIERRVTKTQKPRHGRVLENGSERCGLTPGDFLQGEKGVEALLLASASVAVWMSIQSRDFGRLQVLNHVSLSFAVDVISTSRSCDTASKKRETKISVVSRSCQSGRKQGN